MEGVAQDVTDNSAQCGFLLLSASLPSFKRNTPYRIENEMNAGPCICGRSSRSPCRSSLWRTVIKISEETERRTGLIPRLSSCLDSLPEFFLTRQSVCVSFPKFDNPAASLIGHKRPDATAASTGKKP